MTETKLVIAIDGYSSCGKSTFAKAIAKELNFIYIDSGAMYRAVTLFALRNGFIDGQHVFESELKQNIDSVDIDFRKNIENGKLETWLNGENIEEEIRDIDVSRNVSLIAKIREVRVKMVEQQRRMSAGQSVVMDGRDIGTVVFPDADIKIFMTADKDIRIKRRLDELKAKGLDVDHEKIKENIEERDRIDTTRKESPLRKASDAILLDNSYMTPQEQMVWFKKILENRKI